jgi:hypothetical protein
MIKKRVGVRLRFTSARTVEINSEVADSANQMYLKMGYLLKTS